MNQIPIQVLSKMLANVLEGVGDNYVTFLVITNNGTKNNLVASALPGCVQWPCWWRGGARAGRGLGGGTVTGRKFYI